MKLDWTQDPLAEGLQRYQTGEFFAAHESWESLWMVAGEPEKKFLQGLILVTAAFHHLERNNPVGTRRLLERALLRLEDYPANFGSISVALLCEDIRQWLAALVSGEPFPPFGCPRIRLTNARSSGPVPYR